MKLTIVIPCYNEEEVLPWTLGKMDTLVTQLKTAAATDTSLLLVDDGSRDRTWDIICEAAKAKPYVHGLKLSHNEGHQNALWAGLQESAATSDAVVSIDADLQDDESTIIDMARLVNEGKDIVYGVRKSRKTDSWFKRFTAQSFYRLMKSVDKEVIYNHADFRMMTRRAVEALMLYPERNLFLRAIVRQLGFNEGFVYTTAGDIEVADTAQNGRAEIVENHEGHTQKKYAQIQHRHIENVFRCIEPNQNGTRNNHACHH
mgnify:CR=1 FL=1